MEHGHSDQGQGITVDTHHPLIGVVLEGPEGEVIRFFCSEEEADRAIPGGAALALAGAWADLEWEDMEDQLRRIRHESPPSPPLTL